MPAAIENDLACGGCDYNLRGLPRDGACPECGHAIGSTLRGFSRARALWLRRLSRGAALIGGAILIGGAGACATVEWREPWVFYTLPIAAVMGCVGTWMFASRERRRSVLEFALRVTGVITCALQLLVTRAFMQATGFWTAPAITVGNIMAMSQLTAIVWAIAAVFTFIRAARVASAIGDSAGAAQAWMLALFNASTLVSGAAIWGVISGVEDRTRVGHITAVVILSVWSAMFFLGFALVLRRAARRVDEEFDVHPAAAAAAST